MTDLAAMLEADQKIRDNPDLRCSGTVSQVFSPEKCEPTITEKGPCSKAAAFEMVFTIRSGVTPRKACMDCISQASIINIIHTVTRIDGEEPFYYEYGPEAKRLEPST